MEVNSRWGSTANDNQNFHLKVQELATGFFKIIFLKTQVSLELNSKFRRFLSTKSLFLKRINFTNSGTSIVFTKQLLYFWEIFWQKNQRFQAKKGIKN